MSSDSEVSISDLEQKIRSYLTAARRFRVLRQDRHESARMMSALDVVGDAECAFDSYLAEVLPRDIGLTYVFIYGVMQLLYVQQDAVKALWWCVFEEKLPNDKLPGCRFLRNQFVGHPVADEATEKVKKKNKEKRSGFIARGMMNPNRFSAMTMGMEDGIERRTVDLRDEIATQRRELGVLLRKIVEKIRAEEEAHLESFRDQKLGSIWKSADHLIQKLFSGIESAENRASAVGFAHFLGQMAQDMESQLKARDELFPKEQQEIHILLHALSRLESYYISDSSRLTRDDADIYCCFVDQQVTKLAAMCGQIDDRYAGRETNGDAVTDPEFWPVVVDTEPELGT